MALNSKPLIIDTGFFVALGNAHDQHHKKAVALLDYLPKRHWVTTWPVLTEVCHLLLRTAPSSVHILLQNLEIITHFTTCFPFQAQRLKNDWGQTWAETNQPEISGKSLLV